MLKVKKFTVGPLGVNCYVLINGKECIIIDPADEFEVVNAFIDEKQLQVVGLFVTHAHFDHIRELNKYTNHYQLPVHIHPKEVDFINDPTKNLSMLFTEVIKHNISITIIKDDEITIGSFKFKPIHSPGHSPGSIMYYFREDSLLFTGDVLFKGSIGRTDFPTSSFNELKNSLRVIPTLPKNTIVYPGHGDKTTIRQELEQNPYLKK